MLVSYKDLQSDNPSAYHLLYYFYTECTEPSEEKRKNLVEEYCGRWQSDKFYSLQFIDILEEDNSAEVAHVYFSVLDYVENRDDVDIWTRFRNFLDVCSDDKECVVKVREGWEQRQAWWPHYHFTKRRSLNEQLSSIKLESYKLIRTIISE